jgi:ABC-type Fe3+-hydroxamate transport system substrate-binding protein
VRHGKIYRFDDELISRAGPRIGIGVQKLARLIHPEAFKKG